MVSKNITPTCSDDRLTQPFLSRHATLPSEELSAKTDVIPNLLINDWPFQWVYKTNGKRNVVRM